jgi:hypothetical protein
MTEVTIYDVSTDEIRTVTQEDINLLLKTSECGGLMRMINRKLDIRLEPGMPMDWAAYLKKLRAVVKFIDSL